jgi:hypothetical protein
MHKHASLEEDVELVIEVKRGGPAPTETQTDLEAYSHSIINEPSALLIRKALAAASQTFTVIFTVNLSGTSMGAGFRAVLRKLTCRDLSTSIDFDDGCQRYRRASALVG